MASGNVLANDQAPAGQTLTVAAVNGIAVNGTTTIAGTYGTLVIAPNGAYTYTLASGQTNVTQLLLQRLAFGLSPDALVKLPRFAVPTSGPSGRGSRSCRARAGTGPGGRAGQCAWPSP